MDRDGGPDAGMEHAVDRARRDNERRAGIEHAGRGSGVEAQPVLPDLPVNHDDCRGRVIVVVKARVLVRAPADKPGVDAVVIPDLLVDAGIVGVADGVAPQLGPRGQPVGERSQLSR